jgi:hypothetical protein
MPSEWIWAQLKEHFSTGKFWTPTVLVLFIISFLYKERHFLLSVLKPYPDYYIRSFAIFSFGTVSILYNIFIWKSLIIYILGGCLIVLPLLSIPVRYLFMQKSLKKVITIFKTKEIDDCEIKALNKLKNLSNKKMSEKQIICAERYKIYILTHLGNNRAVEKIIEKVGPEKLEQAHFYLIKYIVAWHSGDIIKAHNEIIKARDAISDQTEPVVQVEILMNVGVSYVAQKNYHAADDSFNLAVREYKRLDLNNKPLLDIIYNNYAFNKTRLGADDQSWKEVVSDYRSLLDFDCLNDQLNYFNFELQILRQTNAPREELSGMVKNNFTRFMDSDLPIKHKVLFAGSGIRIAWSAMLDPSKILSVINENYTILDTLHPIARYRINKELSLIFKDLIEEQPEQNSILRDRVRCYMEQQAEKDIQAHRRTLPDEAIYARCYCLEELASIEKNKKDYNAHKIISFLSDTVKLYQDNSLLMNEIKSRLNIIDELCAIQNFSETLELSNPEDMRIQLYEIESLLPKLRQHPIRAEIGIRMSSYYLIIHEYDKCIEYYDWFDKVSLSLNHFAPWLHRYRMFTAFAVRILYFKNIVVALKDSQEVLLCTNDVQEWFQSFPNHNGVLDSMLLARFIGWREYPIKTLKWFNPNTPEQFKIHSWFYFPELHLNADITYEQFKEEDNKDQIFFNDDQHPFESNKSKTIAKDFSQSGYITEGVDFKIINDFYLSETEMEILEKAFELINKHIPSNCPTQIELGALFQSTMMPVAGI